MSAPTVSDHIARSSLLPRFLVRPERAPAMTAVLAECSDVTPIEALCAAADAGLLLFAVDDFLDDADISTPDALLRVRQWRTVARGEPCAEVAFDPIAGAITTLRARLARRDRALAGLFAVELDRMLAAMGEERRAGDEHTRSEVTPTLRAYLHNGIASVGIIMIACSAWPAMRRTTVDVVQPLLPAARSFALAVRLANDLRSCERERAEVRLNAVSLAGHRVAALGALCERALARGRMRLASTHVARTAQASFLERFASALVALYATRDFMDEPSTAARAIVD